MLPNSSVLVLGAGELGILVLRALARQQDRGQPTDLAVLLCAESIYSKDSRKQQTDVEVELQSLVVRLLAGDLQADSIDELASTFRSFHTVIGCTGFVAGPGIQRD